MSTPRTAAPAGVTPSNFQATPYSAWGFHHVRELHPSARVWRGPEPAQPFPTASEDLGQIGFETTGGARMRIGELLETHYTDGFLVLHRGRVLMERYGHGMRPQDTHILMSTTKSFTGSLTGVLIANGALTDALPVAEAVPALAGSAYAEASVRHLLDMRVGLDFSEDYDDPQSDFAFMDAACGWRPPVRPDAPDNLEDYLHTVRRGLPHGGAFHYVSPNCIVLGWVLEAVTGEPCAELLSRHLWQPMRAEHDADLVLDARGRSQTEGGLNTSLRDLARFGEVHRCEGALGGRQIVPADWVADLRTRGDRKAWDEGSMREWYPGHHYRSLWYTHCEHPRRPFFTLGAFGQIVYVDPVAEVVIAKLSCHPAADDPFGNEMRAFRAIADALQSA